MHPKQSASSANAKQGVAGEESAARLECAPCAAHATIAWSCRHSAAYWDTHRAHKSAPKAWRRGSLRFSPETPAIALLVLNPCHLGPQHLPGGGPVLVLAAFVLALHHRVGGEVRQTDGRRGFVDVLPPAPEAQNTSSRTSLSQSMAMSTLSSTSGTRSIAANDVCRRPAASNGLIRMSR